MIVRKKGYPVKIRTLATKVLADLFEALVAVCNRLGLWQNCVVEAAIREKIEDLLDGKDLCKAVKGATGFHSWEDVKAEASKKGRE